MASADSSQFVVTTADETACETSTLKVRTLSPHLSATSTRTSGNFWTSSLLADLSVFPSLICDFCPSDQGFAYSFLQIPPHDGHPCCSAIHFLVAQACSGLSPVRARPWRANQKRKYHGLPRYFLNLSTVLFYRSHPCRFSRPRSASCSGKGVNSMPSIQFSYKNCLISVMSLDS